MFFLIYSLSTEVSIFENFEFEKKKDLKIISSLDG